MAQSLRELMTPDPVILEDTATVTQAAQRMRERDVGNVLVQHDQEIRGIVTDRDVTIRCVAEEKDPASQTLKDLCSEDLATLQADASIDDAISLMKDRAVRRVPVMENGHAVGIVSLGDLAEEREPKSALGQISNAPANQ